MERVIYGYNGFSHQTLSFKLILWTNLPKFLMEKDIIIAHLKQKTDWIIQTNEDHCEAVAVLTQRFANEFGFGDVGYITGKLHDKGKERKPFQIYIRYISGYDKTIVPTGNKDHAYVGALVAKLHEDLYILMSYPIMGHHAGLPDCTDFEKKMQLPLPSEVRPCHLENVLTPSISLPPKDLHHLIRMLFSCLVDADYLDTEKFMNPDNYETRINNTSLKELNGKLDIHLKQLKDESIESPVNKIRALVQDTCCNSASLPPGFYSLTVPTGGGKTLSSLVWAIHHAITHGKKRIIIAVPYTSIIVQTAKVLTEIFGEENILEHYSNVEFDEKGDPLLKLQKKLATENWDYPIIVTTNVQLFESMFSNKPSKCRKLHNICNSVLILDEVQTLPTEHLQPIIDGLNTYQELFGVSVLFTTASMPSLKGNHKGCNASVTLKGIHDIKEIIPPSYQLHEKLRRVRLHFDKESCNYEEMAERLNKQDKVLCIVNTRRDAFEIYSRLSKTGSAMHLSKMMCPAHLRKKIEELRNRLKNDPTLRVVSTQLIEAGVDIDFPVVYRQEAGLDSILQAAGRCNREGRLKRGDSYVFSLEKEHSLPPGYISQAVNAFRNMKIDRDTDLLNPIEMDQYFRQLYCRVASFDKGPDGETQMIQNLLYTPKDFYFKTASDKFRLIDDATINVIVNWENSAELIERIKKEGPHYKLMKQLSQYAVSIRRHDFDILAKDRLIEEIIEGIYWISDREQYDENTGLTTKNHWLEELLIK